MTEAVAEGQDDLRLYSLRQLANMWSCTETWLRSCVKGRVAGNPPLKYTHRIGRRRLVSHEVAMRMQAWMSLRVDGRTKEAKKGGAA